MHEKDSQIVTIMISVIIPTYNEEAHIKATIQKLWQYDESNLIKEVIIADGGSVDNTIVFAKTEGVKIIIRPDQLTGGFARYSTDANWHVRHFEKMLYDNAQLVCLYTHAYRLTKNPLYEDVVMKHLIFLIITAR